jgi:hypothetical protein
MKTRRRPGRNARRARALAHGERAGRPCSHSAGAGRSGKVRRVSAAGGRCPTDEAEANKGRRHGAAATSQGRRREVAGWCRPGPVRGREAARQARSGAAPAPASSRDRDRAYPESARRARPLGATGTAPTRGRGRDTGRAACHSRPAPAPARTPRPAAPAALRHTGGTSARGCDTSSGCATRQNTDGNGSEGYPTTVSQVRGLRQVFSGASGALGACADSGGPAGPAARLILHRGPAASCS